MPFGHFKKVDYLQIGQGAGTLDDPFEVVVSLIDNGETTAIAQAIAAVPELIGALEALIDPGVPGSLSPHPAWRQARQALAKAQP